jgi:hypothetical protein
MFLWQRQKVQKVLRCLTSKSSPPNPLTLLVPQMAPGDTTVGSTPRYSEKVCLPVLLDGIRIPGLIDEIFCILQNDNSLRDAASSLDYASPFMRKLRLCTYRWDMNISLSQSENAGKKNSYESSVFVMMKFSEGLAQDHANRFGIMIEHNWRPRPGLGSCIFLHVWDSVLRGTAGCTAVSSAHLEQLLRWMDAQNNPLIIQLPLPEYVLLRQSWELP